MLYRIANVIGNIPEQWKQGYETAYRSGTNQLPGALTNPSKEQVIQKLQLQIPQASPVALDLIYQMIQWDPSQRPTATECLKHPFFQGSKQS